jgi:hypothetical protein
MTESENHVHWNACRRDWSELLNLDSSRLEVRTFIPCSCNLGGERINERVDIPVNGHKMERRDTTSSSTGLKSGTSCHIHSIPVGSPNVQEYDNLIYGRSRKVTWK